MLGQALEDNLFKFLVQRQSKNYRKFQLLLLSEKLVIHLVIVILVTGFSSGASTEALLKPAELQFDQVEFSNGISGEKSKRKILRIIDEIILGNALRFHQNLYQT